MKVPCNIALHSSQSFWLCLPKLRSTFKRSPILLICTFNWDWFCNNSNVEGVWKVTLEYHWIHLIIWNTFAQDRIACLETFCDLFQKLTKRWQRRKQFIDRRGALKPLQTGCFVRWYYSLMGGAIVLMGSLVVNRQLLQLNYSSLFEINSEFSLWRTGQQKWKLEREAFT